MRKPTTVLLSLAVVGAFGYLAGCASSNPAAQSKAAEEVMASPCSSKSFTVDALSTYAPDVCVSVKGNTQLTWKGPIAGGNLLVTIPDWTGVSNPPTSPSPYGPMPPCTASGPGAGSVCTTPPINANATPFTWVQYSVKLGAGAPIYGRIIIDK